ncbi:MAG: hypothetical protein IPH78_01980 [Bacteroidetes bacterium]|nr:hypothetical protein [Bacteroidota bacterium]
MRSSLFLLSLLLSLRLWAQPDVVVQATQYIVAKEYATANRYLDSVLKKQKRNVDALMMKGNVVLNAALDTTQSVWLFSTENESVLHSELRDKKSTYDPRMLAQVEAIWLKCLSWDKRRTDIRKGLCSVYSLYGAQQPLLQQIRRIKQQQAADDEQVYSLATYARKVKAEVGFREGMQVYTSLAALYPQVAGLRCDIASEYFYQGDLKSCFQWLDSCSRFSRLDETSLLNGAFIYSQLGYFEDALHWLQRYDTTYQRSMSVFYRGLMNFAEDGNMTQLRQFVQQADSNLYFEEYKLATRLLEADTAFGLSTFNACMATNPPEWYQPFLYVRTMKKNATACEPMYRYGMYQNRLRNFSAAVQLLAEGANCTMTEEQHQLWLLQYAYALHQTNNHPMAHSYFLQLTESPIPFCRQAATYLLINREDTSDKTTEALYRLSQAQPATKYAVLAQQHWMNRRGPF